LLLFAAFYFVALIVTVLDDDTIPAIESPQVRQGKIAIFGASGTAGDGILKAALANPEINYLDYSAIREKLAHLDAVFWAIGTSSVGVDEEAYGMIHVDFPVRFVTEWLSVSDQSDSSFHYISSSDISADSSMMWAREKVRAEETLFKLAEGTNLRVIAYRPDYIGPTKEGAGIGQNLLYWFFRPVNAAVKATQIGQAMIEVTARGSEFSNGDILPTRKILQYSDAYERRLALVIN